MLLMQHWRVASSHACVNEWKWLSWVLCAGEYHWTVFQLTPTTPVLTGCMHTSGKRWPCFSHHSAPYSIPNDLPFTSVNYSFFIYFFSLLALRSQNQRMDGSYFMNSSGFGVILIFRISWLGSSPCLPVFGEMGKFRQKFDIALICRLHN